MGVRSLIRRLTGKPAPRSSARPVRGTYDAARTSTDNQNTWANADRLDADSANSKEVRHTLISRARYEVGSNGYADGIAQTYATDLVGLGPTLRMQTGNQNFNQLIERKWYQWTQAVQFRRKLWCMAHAKGVDGESFAVLRRNSRLRNEVTIDMVLYEAEQCQTPYVPLDEANYIDGIKFDDFGNPLYYDFLKQHPGDSNGLRFTLEAEKVPAEFVLHWFRMRRPGQHRGVPESASTLNLGAAARRFREATLAAAETAADFTMFLHTTAAPDETGSLTPMTTTDIEKRMMTALPDGYSPFQMKAEHPGTTYAEFHKLLVNEQARAKNMPYNKAACDSSSYNYASGRLDHQTYYAALDVDREDCNDLVLEPLFRQWFDMAVRHFGWLGGDAEAVGAGARFHVWDWPKHRVADVNTEADANETKLQSGQIFLHRLFSDAGLDLEDELEAAAESFGVEVDVLRTRLLDVILPPPKQEAAPQGAPKTDSALAALISRVPVNGNGAHHVN